MKKILLAMGILALSVAGQANEKSIRATDMGPAMWSELSRGKLNNTVVEFRNGDELPVSFEAQGDLFETRQTSLSYIVIKRNFWVRLSQNSVDISLDGTNFKNLSEVLKGSLEAGAGSAQNGGIADAINIVFKAILK